MQVYNLYLHAVQAISRVSSAPAPNKNPPRSHKFHQPQVTTSTTSYNDNTDLRNCKSKPFPPLSSFCRSSWMAYHCQQGQHNTASYLQGPKAFLWASPLCSSLLPSRLNSQASALSIYFLSSLSQTFSASSLICISAIPLLAHLLSLGMLPSQFVCSNGKLNVTLELSSLSSYHPMSQLASPICEQKFKRPSTSISSRPQKEQARTQAESFLPSSPSSPTSMSQSLLPAVIAISSTEPQFGAAFI